MSESAEMPATDDLISATTSRRPLGSLAAGSLRSRRSPLASAARQLQVLAEVPLDRARFAGDFARAVSESAAAPLCAGAVEVLQINLGKLCNMTCRHCHVDAGPDRGQETMDRDTIEACLRALDRTGAHTVDITGGAPELNPHFRYLVEEARARGRHVIDRCNLTVLLLARHGDLPQWLADRSVEVVCSLPHHRRRNTDAQRGEGAFSKSVEALRRLNAAGYGHGDPTRRLTLVMNPAGAVLTGDQAGLEREWRDRLVSAHGVTFDRLIALTNMPIGRFLEWLQISGNLDRYLERLVESFNPATVAGLMCRNTLSVSWDGTIYDCDFNQMLELPSRIDGRRALRIGELASELVEGRRVVTARHCFGCTAGAGSSCGGAIER